MTDKIRIASVDKIPCVKNYLMLIGAEMKTPFRAAINDQFGSYSEEVVSILFTREGNVKITGKKASLIVQPDEKLTQEFADEIPRYDLPSLVLRSDWRRAEEPPMLREADPRQIFTFRNRKGEIIMKQVRKDNPNKGTKVYLSFTAWDDGEIRMMEPDDRLPLWGLEQLNQNHKTVFLHEGAKAARRMAEMVQGNTQKDRDDLANHPWGPELSSAAHLGWIGGAKSGWARTDFTPLQEAGVTKVFVVSDNDRDGVRAVPEISKRVRCATYHVQFTKTFPRAFDLGDQFPEAGYRTVGGQRHWVKETFRECLHPATWATDKRPAKSKGGTKAKGGRPSIFVRDHFAAEWQYVDDAAVFVWTVKPELKLSEKAFDKMMAAFSDTSSLSSFLHRQYDGRKMSLCYRPGAEEGFITVNGKPSINVFTPTPIPPTPGDASPFLEFMAYLITDKGDREKVLRWIATLIARPAVRMHYSLLLVSEQQGTGKNTLMEFILGPLVGQQNFSMPTASTIVKSEFNSWAAEKRLVGVAEIYEGHSWTAYNVMKTYITDKTIEVNRKFHEAYKIENYIHFVACSNSNKALRIDNDDRRWLIPMVTETVWPSSKFAALYDWLDAGGLGIIHHWAKEYGDYVEIGERAPDTARKKEMIDESQSDVIRDLVSVVKANVKGQAAIRNDRGGSERPLTDGFVFTAMHVREWLKEAYRNFNDTDHELGKAMVRAGMVRNPEKIKVDGRTQYVYWCDVAWEKFGELPKGDRNAKAKELSIRPRQLLPEADM